MSDLSDILNRIPVNQLASQLDTDPDTAQSVAKQAITSLLGGMESNVASPAGAESLAGALQQHVDSPLASEDPVDLDQVNTHDGAKITDHVFGAAGVPTSGSTSESMMSKAMKILAPIVLAYLAKKAASGDFGSVLGSVLGGQQQSNSSAGDANTTNQTAQSDATGGALGQILGSLLGR